MTQFVAPPPGYVAVEIEDGGVMTPERMQYRDAQGRVWTAAELVAAGVLPDAADDEDV